MEMVLMTLWVLTFDPTNLSQNMAGIKKKETLTVPAEICKSMQKLAENPVKLHSPSVAVVAVECVPIAKK